ncbi:MAG: ribonuclease P protein component [Rhizobiaceae bacterium]|nr:MAG: ribonuclease P protein component [Rhizobiaceae bacterium]
MLTDPERKPYKRLRKRAEFLAVRRGEKRRGRYFLLEVLDRRDGGTARAGVTVTKKTGDAVTRNRIRRRLKEALRTHAADDMAAGRDYVIVGRPEILDVPFDTLKKELSRRMSGNPNG